MKQNVTQLYVYLHSWFCFHKTILFILWIPSYMNGLQWKLLSRLWFSHTLLSFCLFTSLHCPLFSLALSAADRGWPMGVGKEPALARNFQFQLDLTGVGGVQVGSVKIHQPLFLKIPPQHSQSTQFYHIGNVLKLGINNIHKMMPNFN